MKLFKKERLIYGIKFILLIKYLLDLKMEKNFILQMMFIMLFIQFINHFGLQKMVR